MKSNDESTPCVDRAQRRVTTKKIGMPNLNLG